MFTLFDILGIIGICFTIINYAQLQWRRDYAKDILYSGGNLIGSGLLLLSLTEKWNPASFLATLIMATISLYGVYRCLKYYVRARQIEKILKSRL